MFTRKHFQVVAQIIKEQKQNVENNYPLAKGEELMVPVFKMAESFADEFAASNPRFDRDRFLKACGFTE